MALMCTHVVRYNQHRMQPPGTFQIEFSINALAIPETGLIWCAYLGPKGFVTPRTCCEKCVVLCGKWFNGHFSGQIPWGHNERSDILHIGPIYYSLSIYQNMLRSLNIVHFHFALGLRAHQLQNWISISSSTTFAWFQGPLDFHSHVS